MHNVNWPLVIILCGRDVKCFTAKYDGKEHLRKQAPTISVVDFTVPTITPLINNIYVNNILPSKFNTLIYDA
jgi:hypothetical protein